MLALIVTQPGALTAQCGDNTPALPVPETRGSVQLWPTGFRPGGPGLQLPAERDSTQYDSFGYPYAGTGHELFWGLDIASERLFVSYNVGIQAWNISGALAENPQRIAFRDGILGHWFFHPPIGEDDGGLNDIAALPDPSNSNRVLLAVAGRSPVGVSLWRFDKTAGTLTQLYQNTNRESHQVKMLAFAGVAYAFFSSPLGPTPGAFVVNVSVANALPVGCLDAACPPGIDLGRVGTAAASRYVGVVEWGGKIYVASSVGGLAPSSPGPEIWELTNPAVPATAVRRWLGTVKDTHSPILLAHLGQPYLAVVEAKRLRLYDVASCLDSDGCASLPSPLHDDVLRNQNWSANFLSYSLSGTTPFLYYGVEAPLLSGTTVERLVDLSALGGSNILPEITASGQTYTDECNGASGIGYWADYYERNDHGFRNFAPRKGKFNGDYFYRVTTATLDVHVRASSQLFSDGFEAGNLLSWD